SVAKSIGPEGPPTRARALSNKTARLGLVPLGAAKHRGSWRP
ncbi:DUF6053 domain-containing protein, partial [Lysobacter sp. 2RAB21]